jgi:hypothetical protein
MANVIITQANKIAEWTAFFTVNIPIAEITANGANM